MFSRFWKLENIDCSKCIAWKLSYVNQHVFFYFSNRLIDIRWRLSVVSVKMLDTWQHSYVNQNVFFYFSNRLIDIRWRSSIVSVRMLNTWYICDAFMIHAWFIHDAFIRSLNENDSISSLDLIPLFKKPSIHRIYLLVCLYVSHLREIIDSNHFSDTFLMIS